MTDAVLIRAPAGVVYRTLTDLDGWPRWYAGCRSERAPVLVGPVPPSGGSAPVVQGTGDQHRLVLPGRRRSLRLAVGVSGWRHDTGVQWSVQWSQWSQRSQGNLVAEWWLEGRRDGVVLHHLVHPSERRGQANGVLRMVDAYRHGVMLAMQAMKDHLELAVALAAGRVP